MSEFKRIFQLNRVNKNGRIYSAENFSGLEEKIKTGMLGQLGHPEHFGVSLSASTHQIKDVSINGDDLIITAHILDIDSDEVKAVKELLNDLVLSPRGVGSCDEEGRLVDYELLTFDLINKADAAWEVKEIES